MTAQKLITNNLIVLVESEIEFVKKIIQTFFGTKKYTG